MVNLLKFQKNNTFIESAEGRNPYTREDIYIYYISDLKSIFYKLKKRERE